MQTLRSSILYHNNKRANVLTITFSSLRINICIYRSHKTNMRHKKNHPFHKNQYSFNSYYDKLILIITKDHLTMIIDSNQM